MVQRYKIGTVLMRQYTFGVLSDGNISQNSFRHLEGLIRKTGWPTVAKTFRTKRDAEDWSRRTEDEMVRGVYIQRSGSERMTLEMALKRYLNDITPTKKPTTQRGEISKAKKLTEHLGRYSLAALSAEIIADFRDKRLNEKGRAEPPATIPCA
ncbi:Site-specific recombinase, phage integrase family [Pseudomonas syringae pv. primulae]|uniref:Site-specific recombinase, phage integrase family n=1 Tax=Pseudomonas syringae pv. primulae TaxID=251707 RepID=A0A3M4SFF9_9PSED|nr:Site-specific recombinase, phage integrase family [Pseudomonas syringae pv. primulae]